MTPICVEGYAPDTHPLEAHSPEEVADLLDKRGTEAARLGRYELASELCGAAKVLRALIERLD